LDDFNGTAAARLSNPGMYLVEHPLLSFDLRFPGNAVGKNIDPDTPFIESGNCCGYDSPFDQRHEFGEHEFLLLRDLSTAANS
jgi:hypothetical protein